MVQYVVLTVLQEMVSGHLRRLGAEEVHFGLDKIW